MDVSTLKRYQLLKELQQYEKYQGKTQKELSKLLGNVATMRSELIKLNTVDEKIVDEHIINDVIYSIFLNADYLEIVELCSVSKQYKKICDQDLLWKQLIERDFPFIFIDCNIQDEYTYKKLYEKTHFVIYSYINKIILPFEKNRKHRYTTYIFKNLFNLIVDVLNKKKVYYDVLTNDILTLLNPKRRKDNTFYTPDKEHVNYFLKQLFTGKELYNCNDIKRINLKLLYI